MPEDVSVVGFDDIRMSFFARPSLTTIRQPLETMGATAATFLLEDLRTGTSATRQVLIEPELIVRQSTGTAARP